MSNIDETNGLTEDEQLRFDELFSPSDRLSLTHDWRRVLSTAIAEELSDGAVDAPLAHGGAEVIDFAEARARRGWGSGLLIAAAVILIGGVGISALLGRNTISTGELDDVPVLAPDREVDPPTFRRFELPVGATLFAQADDGTIVAIAENDQAETTVHTFDGQTWVEGQTLPVYDAVLDASEAQWIIGGKDSSTRIPSPSLPEVTVATGVAVFRSTDGGASWNDTDVALTNEPREFVTDIVDSVSVAAHDGVELVTVSTRSDVNIEALVADLGVLGPDDRIFLYPEGDSEVGLFVVGPDRFEPVEINPEDVGMTRNDLEDLLFASRIQDGELFRAETSESFIPIDGPSDFGLVSTAIIALADDGFVTFTFPSGRPTPVSSDDGLEWTEIDLDEVYDQIGPTESGWIVRTQPFDEGVEQSLDGGRTYSQAPAPNNRSMPFTLVETEFGAAVVWQDLSRAVAAEISPEYEIDGFRLDVAPTGNFTLIDPDGNVLTEDQNWLRPPRDRVLAESSGAIIAFDEGGEISFLLTDEQLRELENVEPTDELSSGRLISWSTDGEDWKFASLDGIGPGFWEFADTELGLVGIDVEDLTSAVIIEWPDEVADG